METLKQEQKAKAIELMKTLGIYEPYIQDFMHDNRACVFENYVGYWIDQYPVLLAKVKELEAEYNCLVYAVTHEYTNIGEMYSMLIIPAYPEDWENLIHTRLDNGFVVYAYVWNKTDELCSEFGSIGVHSFGGGIRRTA